MIRRSSLIVPALVFVGCSAGSGGAEENPDEPANGTGGVTTSGGNGSGSEPSTSGGGTGDLTGGTSSGGGAAGGNAATGGGTSTGGGANVGHCSTFSNGSGTTQPCYVGNDGTAYCIADDGTTTALSQPPGSIISVTGRNFAAEACAVNDTGAIACGAYATMTEWVASGATQVSGSLTGQCAIVDGAVQCSGVGPDNPNTGAGVVTEVGCFYRGCCAATNEGKMYC